MSDELTPRPVPEPDESSAAYWDAARDRRLVVQRCETCGRAQFPPDVACIHCQSTDVGFVDVSGRASLYSFTIVERPFHTAFVESLPYVVGIVELEDHGGVRMLTNIVDVAPEAVEIGMPLQVTFEDVGDATLPQFRPSEVGT